MVRDQAYREAEKRIEAARRSGAKELDLSNKLDIPDDVKPTELPKTLRQRTELMILNRLTTLPESLGQLTQLQSLGLNYNQLTDLPASPAQLEHLEKLTLDNNPLNPELAEAYKQGLDAVKAYLRAKAEAQITLNEAKLILIGEGEVGKSCLLGALRGDPWKEGRPTTHGIEIKLVKVTDPDSKKEITLNGWDFGRLRRPRARDEQTPGIFVGASAI
jgi:hypothetical protein